MSAIWQRVHELEGATLTTLHESKRFVLVAVADDCVRILPLDGHGKERSVPREQIERIANLGLARNEMRSRAGQEFENSRNTSYIAALAYEAARRALAGENDSLPHKWLTERCTSTDPREIRLQEMASLELSDENKQKLLDLSEPFRQWAAAKWKPFVGLMLPGDELWRFCSPEDTWSNLAGRAGYAIVRDGVVLHSLVTLLN